MIKLVLDETIKSRLENGSNFSVSDNQMRIDKFNDLVEIHAKDLFDGSESLIFSGDLKQLEGIVV